MKLFFLVMVLVILAPLTLTNAEACTEACVVKRTADGRIARSSYQVVKFKRSVPCPATNVISKTCPGYIVDHVVPLCNCGKDAPSNMQWQTKADSLLKDRWERNICQERG